MRLTQVVGVGDFTPETVVSNESIARTIPGWSADLIRERTGILERRFLCALDEERGRAVRPHAGATNVDMAGAALLDALEMAQLGAHELDALFLVTCTPDRVDFNHDAMELHRQLHLRTSAPCFVINDGCGGTPYVLDLVDKLIRSGAMETVALVSSNFASAFVDRAVYGETLNVHGKALSGYLSMYVFGDGAGAAILRGSDGDGRGILSTLSGNAHQSLVLRRGGGAELPALAEDAKPAEFAFVVNGHEVAASYPIFMRTCLGGVCQNDPERLTDVKRYYLHQPNKRVLDKFAATTGLKPEQVASTVERYGNTSAASMLVALSEDVRKGVVALGSGDLVCIAAAGANVHYGAQLIRL
jgi:3-oxoacyl-[acyl-carrier-protein] synthase III